MVTRSLKLSKELNANIDANEGFNLKVPDENAPVPANVRGNGDTATYTWMETLNVLDAGIAGDQKNEAWTVVSVTFRVPAEQADSVNQGRMFSQWYRFNPEAVTNPKHEDAVMTRINLSRLKSLAKGAGWPMEDDDDLLAPFDTGEEQGGQAPIVGAQVVAKFVDKPGKDRDKNTHDPATGKIIRKQEPTAFYSPDQING